jgi:hypothetical protein
VGRKSTSCTRILCTNIYTSRVPFRFTGKLNNLTLTIDCPRLSPADIKTLKEAQRNNKVSE